MTQHTIQQDNGLARGISLRTYRTCYHIHRSIRVIGDRAAIRKSSFKQTEQ